MIEGAYLRLTFNRTSMELKQDFKADYEKLQTTFNRTSMELKHWQGNSFPVQFFTFNRTSMELKRDTTFVGSIGIVALLIEPVWN